MTPATPQVYNINFVGFVWEDGLGEYKGYTLSSHYMFTTLPLNDKNFSFPSFENADEKTKEQWFKLTWYVTNDTEKRLNLKFMII